MGWKVQGLVLANLLIQAMCVTPAYDVERSMVCDDLSRMQLDVRDVPNICMPNLPVLPPFSLLSVRFPVPIAILSFQM